MGLAERRAREKEMQRSKRRLEILNAARTLFRVRGYSGTTMEDIAREAELSPGALYLYFKNKEELWASLSFEVLEHVNETIKRVYNEKEQSAEKKLERLTETLYKIYEFDPFSMINLIRLQASEKTETCSAETLFKIDELTAETVRSIARFFEDAIQAGLFYDRSPIVLADILLSLFHGLVLWEESKRIRDPEKNYLKETMSQAFEVFRYGSEKRTTKE
ncbi:MAG: TetR/AcrR family transcriptional regulator [Thermodesulfobacteriota bacterium]|nr:TetR/AcrR family transcriptional regulator [Thermodesulfobacteriota bacterium]